MIPAQGKKKKKEIEIGLESSPQKTIVDQRASTLAIVDQRAPTLAIFKCLDRLVVSMASHN